jgi:hypothetical protein
MLLHLVGTEQLGSQGRIIGPAAVSKAVPAQPRHPLTHGSHFLIRALSSALPAVTQVPECLAQQFAACGSPILPIKAIDVAASFVLFVRQLGDIGIRGRSHL